MAVSTPLAVTKYQPGRNPVKPSGEKKNARMRKIPASASSNSAAIVRCAFPFSGVLCGLEPEMARMAPMTRKPHKARLDNPSKEKLAKSVTVPPAMVPHANTSKSRVANMASENPPPGPAGVLPPGKTTKGISRRNAADNARIAPRMLNFFALIDATWLSFFFRMPLESHEEQDNFCEEQVHATAQDCACGVRHSNAEYNPIHDAHAEHDEGENERP